MNSCVTTRAGHAHAHGQESTRRGVHVAHRPFGYASPRAHVVVFLVQLGGFDIDHPLVIHINMALCSR